MPKVKSVKIKKTSTYIPHTSLIFTPKLDDDAFSVEVKKDNITSQNNKETKTFRIASNKDVTLIVPYK
jgi:hypothetical protein